MIECKHEFESDGGDYVRCHKTVRDLMDEMDEEKSVTKVNTGKVFLCMSVENMQETIKVFEKEIERHGKSNLKSEMTIVAIPVYSKMEDQFCMEKES